MKIPGFFFAERSAGRRQQRSRRTEPARSGTSVPSRTPQHKKPYTHVSGGKATLITRTTPCLTCGMCAKTTKPAARPPCNSRAALTSYAGYVPRGASRRQCPVPPERKQLFNGDDSAINRNVKINFFVNYDGAVGGGGRRRPPGGHPQRPARAPSKGTGPGPAAAIVSQRRRCNRRGPRAWDDKRIRPPPPRDRKLLFAVRTKCVHTILR